MSDDDHAGFFVQGPVHVHSYEVLIWAALAEAFAGPTKVWKWQAQPRLIADDKDPTTTS